MLFKEGSELPPPRYALDDDEDDVNVIAENYSFAISGDTADIRQLLVVAPRVIGLRSEVAGTAQATVTLGVSRTLAGSEFTDLEGYDTLDESQVSETKLPMSIHSAPRGFHVLALSPLTEPEAAYFAKQLLSHLKLEKLVVAAPGTVYDVAVTALATSKALVPEIRVPQFGLAVPPVIVQGAPAALLSQAQQRHVPAIGYVVSSDGPLNHEAIQPGHFEVLRQVLYGALGYETDRSPELSTLYV